MVPHHTPVYTLFWVGGSGKTEVELAALPSVPRKLNLKTTDLQSILDLDNSDRKSSGPPDGAPRPEAVRVLVGLVGLVLALLSSCPASFFGWKYLSSSPLVRSSPFTTAVSPLSPCGLGICGIARQAGHMNCRPGGRKSKRRNCYSQLLPIACCWTCSIT